MASKKIFGSVKRFGSRYGRTIRADVARIEKDVRRKHKCSLCSKVGVKRVAAGIWECQKCGAKFTGRAYTPIQPNRTLRRAQTAEGKINFNAVKTKPKAKNKQQVEAPAEPVETEEMEQPVTTEE